MEPFRDDELSTALSALRPTPRADFAAELDARVAAGFPRESRLGELSPRAALDWLRALKPRHVLLPAGGLALTAIVVATAVVALNSRGSVDVMMSGGGGGESQVGPLSKTQSMRSEFAPSGDSAAAAEQLKPFSQEPQPLDKRVEKSFDGAGGYTRGGTNLSLPSAASATAAAPLVEKRAVERSAELTLGTAPENVGKASGEVFDVVHAYRGVVLRSQTSDGTAGNASAKFELLIPSAKLGDAMAAFSEIAEVRSRHEATADITAPTVGVAEQLEDSRARIDSLLAQLAAAETESEREAVEAELRGERNRSAALSSQLESLERRASLSRVSVRIESGEAGAAPDAGGSWGIGDALHDAGQILAVAAAVILVSLAVLGPIALIALLAWLTHRAWVRRGRRQALG